MENVLVILVFQLLEGHVNVLMDLKLIKDFVTDVIKNKIHYGMVDSVNAEMVIMNNMVDAINMVIGLEMVQYHVK
jgi:hypothetical protein